MPTRTITISLPEEIYEQLEAQAQHSARSINDVVLQTLSHAQAPSPEEDLPVALQNELRAMEELSNEALWAIAGSRANPSSITLFDGLVDRQELETLTQEDRIVLTQLRNEMEALMVRKAHAYALLHSRNGNLPIFGYLA